MKENQFPPGWDEDRVQRVFAYYESQTEDEAVAEDKAAFESPTETVMIVPVEMVAVIRELLARHSPSSP